ncbi:leucine-rich repeat protein kinase family protein [Striga asiatica]|uniref:Leucine-rich repeat protein kinase family protein n=1 Tax=Striga asiatica TaxID=4170 RepID=A0A5A7Q6Z1_STRAF|nr:leucine-rich repeat protein kinase family protein [Striga asiatica]
MSCSDSRSNPNGTIGYSKTSIEIVEIAVLCGRLQLEIYHYEFETSRRQSSPFAAVRSQKNSRSTPSPSSPSYRACKSCPWSPSGSGAHRRPRSTALDPSSSSKLNANFLLIEILQSIAAYRSLKNLVLTDNLLNGTAPDLGGLPPLEDLDLSRNSVGLKFLSLGTNLVRLSLVNNSFRSEIPTILNVKWVGEVSVGILVQVGSSEELELPINRIDENGKDENK